MVALSDKRPGRRALYQTGFEALEKDLLALDETVKKLTARKPNEPLVASHPVYQYLARRYGLELESVMWEPDEVPDDGEWAALRDLLRRYPARWMLWEGDPSPVSAERLKAMGVGSVVFSPCSNRPTEGDFMDVMRSNVGNLEVVFR